MSDTPRTDEQSIPMGGEEVVDSRFARQLERELVAAHAVLDADESKIIRNAKDGYPEGREPHELTLAERVQALCKYASDWMRWHKEKEKALAESHAREVQLREALEPLSKRFYEHRASCKASWKSGAECDCGLVSALERMKQALTLPPPPVVSEEEYEDLMGSFDVANKAIAEQTGKLKSLEDKYDADIAILNERFAQRAIDYIEHAGCELTKLRVAEQDAERLAQQLKLVLDQTEMWNRSVQSIIGRQPQTGIETTSPYEALAAHEALINLLSTQP